MSTDQNKEHDDEELTPGSDKKKTPNPKDYENKNRSKEQLQDSEHKMDHHTDYGKMPANITDLNPDEFDSEKLWRAIKSEYKNRHPSLTEDDIDFQHGNYEELKQRIAKRTSRSVEEVDKEIRNWYAQKKN